MKMLVASVFALAVLSAGAADSAVVGAHVGPVHIGLGIHHHRCMMWGRHHRCHRWR